MRRLGKRLAAAVVFVLASWALAVPAEEPRKSTARINHGIAISGGLKYGPDFRHFAYADPKAMKGGKVTFSAIGTFDSLNPFIMKGIAATGVDLLFSRLTVGSRDEPFSQYCLLCETIEVAPDRMWVAFTLRPEARFHDGSPIMADDVVFSFYILKTKGHPFYRDYYKHVVRVEKVGPRKVKFVFDSNQSRELPLIVGELSILSQKYWEKRDFEKTTLDPPLGSGPYVVESIDAGRSITYKRVPDWWGRNLPVEVGRHNFDIVRFIYYRDITVALEAFKAGEYDVRWESSSKQWATGYGGPAFSRGLFRKEEMANESPEGMQGFIFNTRRLLFQDRRVREALGYAFDFEWINQKLMYGAYTRTTSYFERSELAARGLPDAEEMKILEKYRGRIPGEVFTKEYHPPVTDGSGDVRNNLRIAMELLKFAGWTVDGKTRKLVHPRFLDGKGRMRPMEFEILLDSPSSERIVFPFVQNLERLGIVVRIRTVDDSQYVNRLRTFDFDVIIGGIGGQISPGNEQRASWSSQTADVVGGTNYPGVKDPVIDELAELLIAAPDRKSLVTRTRAFDRVLLWGHYVIPHWYTPYDRMAYWNKFGRPAVPSKYGIDFYTWWVDPEKERKLAQ